MLKTIDHIALVVRDLKSAAEHYAALLGRASERFGVDDAEYVRFQLDNMALDIVAPTGQGYTGDRVRAQLDKHGEGIWAIAFATADIEKARHSLERRGIKSTEARSICSTRVDREAENRRKTLLLASEATYGATLFVVEQNPDTTPSVSIETNAPVTGLDHIVITTAQPERAAVLYGARLGLEMKLDRTNPDWGSRLMLFKCGDLIVEIAHSLKNNDPNALDKGWGLSWRVADMNAAHRRMTLAGFNLSEIRVGRKPGTRVFTVRDKTSNVPTLVIGRD